MWLCLYVCTSPQLSPVGLGLQCSVIYKGKSEFNICMDLFRWGVGGEGGIAWEQGLGTTPTRALDTPTGKLKTIEFVDVHFCPDDDCSIAVETEYSLLKDNVWLVYHQEFIIVRVCNSHMVSTPAI